MADIRILIVDDHPLFRAALRQLLENEPGFEVVGEAGNGRDAAEELRRLEPDILLLDLNMPKQSGLEVMRRMANLHPKWRTILVVAAIEKQQVIEGLRLGARGIVLKSMASRLLYKCIRAVMAGGYWVGHEAMSDLVEALCATGEPKRVTKVPDRYGLTTRELEILTAVVDGDTNKEIAEKLKISEPTVKHYLTTIFQKVGVSNRVELALFAMNQRSS